MGTILTHYYLESDWKAKKASLKNNPKKEINIANTNTIDKNQVTQQDNPVRHGPIVMYNHFNTDLPDTDEFDEIKNNRNARK